MNENWDVKISDFGQSNVQTVDINKDYNLTKYVATRYYRAPELIFGATDYTTQVDVWSTGCVIAELMLGQPIFPGDSGVDQLVEIIKILETS